MPTLRRSGPDTMSHPQVPNKAYPIVARSKRMKGFRPNLADFFARLIRATHDSEVLYDDTFCNAVQSWLVAMSSSPVRAFRHTATVVSLTIVSEFALLLNEIVKELASVSRQVATEKGASRKDKGRIKEWERKQKLVHERKETIETFVSELFDGLVKGTAFLALSAADEYFA